MNELVKQDLPIAEEYIEEEYIEGSFRSAEDPPPPVVPRPVNYAPRPLTHPQPKKKTISPYVPDWFVYMLAVATVWYILWIMSMLQHP